MVKQFILPGQPTRYARDKFYEILHTRLEVELDFEKKSISGKVTHEIRAIGAVLDSLKLDAAEMRIASVKVNGVKSRYSTTDSTLAIFPEKPIASGESGAIQVEYAATPKKGLYFRGPSGSFPDRFVHAFTQGQAEDSKYWFPCYDYPNMRASSEVIVEAPEEMIVVANGRLLSTEKSAKKRIWHFKQEVRHPSYLLSLIVGRYDKVEEVHEGINLEYYVPREERDKASRSFSKTPKMLDFFSQKTGQKYPYSKYSQAVVSDFMFGGMENISATTLTDKTLHDERSHLDFTSDNLVAHELAHQWFGDYLTCKDWSQAWLNEGFATYFNALFREYDEGVEDFQYSLNGYRENLTDEMNDHYQRPVVTKRYWDPEELFDSHTYEKGCWVLNSLRGLIGDDNFFAGIRKYVGSKRDSLVETDDFRKAMEEASGQDLELFFDQWVFSPGYPEYSAKYSWNSSEKYVELQIEQTNAETGGVPLFSTPIEVLFSFEGNSFLSRKIKMNSKKSQFVFSFEEEPLNVNIDPRNWILKKLDFEKPKEMMFFQLSKDENSMERVRACWDLVRFKDDEVIAHLSSAIQSDNFWGVRLEAAAYLGKLGTKSALEALLSNTRHPDHKARRGIAIGLRYFSHLEENDASRAVEALIEFLDSDESYYVRAHAGHSLGFYKKSEAAFNALKSALDQDSVNDQIRYRAFLGFAERKNDERVLQIAIEHLRSGKEFQERQGAAYAIGRVGQGHPEALDSLFAARTESDIRVRSEAANSILLLGEKRALPRLEEWLEGEPSGRCRRRIREAIFFLKESRQEDEKVARLDEDLSKLKDQNKQLMERISVLETRIQPGIRG